MPRTWKELKEALPERTRARMEHHTDLIDAVLSLHELGNERDTTQQEVAERLEQAQGNVSRTLRRADPHLSTLRELIAALGGELELVARFPDRSYAIGMSAGAAWVQRWMEVADTLVVPPEGPTAAEILRADRDRLDRA